MGACKRSDAATKYADEAERNFLRPQRIAPNRSHRLTRTELLVTALRTGNHTAATELARTMIAEDETPDAVSEGPYASQLASLLARWPQRLAIDCGLSPTSDAARATASLAQALIPALAMQLTRGSSPNDPTSIKIRNNIDNVSTTLQPFVHAVLPRLNGYATKSIYSSIPRKLRQVFLPILSPNQPLHDTHTVDKNEEEGTKRTEQEPQKITTVTITCKNLYQANMDEAKLENKRRAGLMLSSALRQSLIHDSNTERMSFVNLAQQHASQFSPYIRCLSRASNLIVNAGLEDKHPSEWGLVSIPLLEKIQECATDPSRMSQHIEIDVAEKNYISGVRVSDIVLPNPNVAKDKARSQSPIPENLRNTLTLLKVGSRPTEDNFRLLSVHLIHLATQNHAWFSKVLARTELLEDDNKKQELISELQERAMLLKKARVLIQCHMYYSMLTPGIDIKTDPVFSQLKEAIVLMSLFGDKGRIAIIGKRNISEKTRILYDVIHGQYRKMYEELRDASINLCGKDIVSSKDLIGRLLLGEAPVAYVSPEENAQRSRQFLTFFDEIYEADPYLLLGVDKYFPQTVIMQNPKLLEICMKQLEVKFVRMTTLSDQAYSLVLNAASGYLMRRNVTNYGLPLQPEIKQKVKSMQYAASSCIAIGADNPNSPTSLYALATAFVALGDTRRAQDRVRVLATFNYFNPILRSKAAVVMFNMLINGRRRNIITSSSVRREIPIVLRAFVTSWLPMPAYTKLHTAFKWQHAYPGTRGHTLVIDDLRQRRVMDTATIIRHKRAFVNYKKRINSSRQTYGLPNRFIISPILTRRAQRKRVALAEAKVAHKSKAKKGGVDKSTSKEKQVTDTKNNMKDKKKMMGKDMQKLQRGDGRDLKGKKPEEIASMLSQTMRPILNSQMFSTLLDAAGYTGDSTFVMNTWRLMFRRPFQFRDTLDGNVLVSHVEALMHCGRDDLARDTLELAATYVQLLMDKRPISSAKAVYSHPCLPRQAFMHSALDPATLASTHGIFTDPARDPTIVAVSLSKRMMPANYQINAKKTLTARRTDWWRSSIALERQLGKFFWGRRATTPLADMLEARYAIESRIRRVLPLRGPASGDPGGPQLVAGPAGGVLRLVRRVW